MKTRREEFLVELDYCKNDMKVWGVSYDIKEPFHSLKEQVKNFFPLNGVPSHIVESLDSLERRIDLYGEQLCLTIDRIIYELEKSENLGSKK